MSDLLIRGTKVALCNGTYNLFGTETNDIRDMVWLSDDKVCVVKTLVIDNVRYWVIASAGYDPVLQTIMSFPQNIYYIAPVLIAEDDVEQRGPYDESLIWEAVLSTDTSKPIIKEFDSDNIVVEALDPVTQEDGSIVTITKYTNIVSGDKWQTTSIVTNKEVPVISEHERYTPINPIIGKVYKFQFVKEFKTLGYEPETVGTTEYNSFKGIYRVDKIIGYYDLISSGVDIFKSLYEPNNVSRLVYQQDINEFLGVSFLKLVDPTDDSKSFYMPESFISAVDANVDKYSKMLLTIDIGIFNDPEMLTELADIVSKLLHKKFGIVTNDTENTQLVSYDSAWMSLDDYKVLEDHRKNISLESPINLADLFCFTESNNLYLENLNLKNKLNACEQIIMERGDVQ